MRKAGPGAELAAPAGEGAVLLAAEVEGPLEGVALPQRRLHPRRLRLQLVQRVDQLAGGALPPVEGGGRRGMEGCQWIQGKWRSNATRQGAVTRTAVGWPLLLKMRSLPEVILIGLRG